MGHPVTLTDPLSLAWLDWMDGSRIPAHTVARRRAVLRGLGNAGTATRADVETWWTSRAHLSAATRANDPIGGHPICGKEKLSLANAERTLYYAAPFLLTPLERTSPRALSAANQIIDALGAKCTVLDAVEHDRILASTSHLPFLISSALSLATPEDVTPFVGPGFKSTSRLAGTSSSMMLGVLQSNRENVLNALHGMQSQLAEIEAALSASDFSRTNR